MADGTAQKCGRVGSCHIYLKSLSSLFLKGFFVSGGEKGDGRVGYSMSSVYMSMGIFGSIKKKIFKQFFNKVSD
jgi:hypothetical protein